MTLSVPSDEILMKYAAGSLDPALRLLVDAHLAKHPATREALAPFVAFGGLLLTAEAPVEMTAGSLDRALARIALPEEAPVAAVPPLPSFDALDWRWAGPGRKLAAFEVPGSSLRSYALRIAPGKAMLQHSHVDQEWTVIVQGAYRDESGLFECGSFIEEDNDTNHRPIATGDEECICLAVMSGPIAAAGVAGAVARWLMR